MTYSVSSTEPDATTVVAMASGAAVGVGAAAAGRVVETPPITSTVAPAASVVTLRTVVLEPAPRVSVAPGVRGVELRR